MLVRDVRRAGGPAAVGPRADDERREDRLVGRMVGDRQRRDRPRRRPAAVRRRVRRADRRERLGVLLGRAEEVERQDAHREMRIGADLDRRRRRSVVWSSRPTRELQAGPHPRGRVLRAVAVGRVAGPASSVGGSADGAARRRCRARSPLLALQARVGDAGVDPHERERVAPAGEVQLPLRDVAGRPARALGGSTWVCANSSPATSRRGRGGGGGWSVAAAGCLSPGCRTRPARSAAGRAPGSRGSPRGHRRAGSR